MVAAANWYGFRLCWYCWLCLWCFCCFCICYCWSRSNCRCCRHVVRLHFVILYSPLVSGIFPASNCDPPWRLRSGGCVFIFAAVDVQDTSQMALLPHFIKHYEGLGVPKSQYLLLVHVRPPGDSRDAEFAARRLRTAHGLPNTKIFVESNKDSLRAFVLAVWDLFRRRLRPVDWIVHVELDELAVFPRDVAGKGAFAASEFFDARDASRENIVYGFIVDRLAANGSLPRVRSASEAGSLFEQFPMNCGATALRRADVRRTVAYRGYLRADVGHHIGLGVPEVLNFTDFFGTLSAVLNGGWSELDWTRYGRARANAGRSMARSLLEAAGPELAAIFPHEDGFSLTAAESVSALRRRGLPHLNAWLGFASIYHFKWNAGLPARFDLLRRRGWVAVAGAQRMPEGHFNQMPAKQICVEHPAQAGSALRADEMLRFLLRWSAHVSAELSLRYRELNSAYTEKRQDFDSRLLLFQFFHTGFDYGPREFAELLKVKE
eukprot:TRINITY_DN44211_c0_g1_i1.p1 TRINITY_DN44211_c0_g1~~TRINITY_DN44211_c0_g1_i1.p1  ORF type:complete len:537 (+),score=65.09 TRINITY_DN44211_c0_g1_i1:140-1612(+)